MARNTYHSPESFFHIVFIDKTMEILLYSFFKSCNYELSFANSSRIEFLTTVYRW